MILCFIPVDGIHCTCNNWTTGKYIKDLQSSLVGTVVRRPETHPSKFRDESEQTEYSAQLLDNTTTTHSWGNLTEQPLKIGMLNDLLF